MMGEDSHRMSEADMGQYRYTLSLEGNDVATDLKWKLASGSLVLMPPPTKEGWLMEGRLQPWVHYVPLDSPEDVDVKLRWCRDNQPAVQVRMPPRRAAATLPTSHTPLLPLPSCRRS